MENIEVIYGEKSQRTNKKILVSEKDFIIPHGKEAFIEPLNYLKMIQKSTINDSTIPELLKYKNFSLWWFIHPTIYPEIKRIINFITKFNEFIDEVNPHSIKINKDFKMFEVIKQICLKKKLKLKFSKTELLKFQTLNKTILKAQKYRYKQILDKKIANRKNLFFQKFSQLPKINNKIIFGIPTIYRRKILNLKTGISENGEYIQKQIMDLIEDSSNIIGIDLDYTFKGNPDILKQRLEEKMPWLPVELLLKNKLKNKHTSFFKNYKKIISNKEFKEKFYYKGISIWKQLESTFTKLAYGPYMPFYLLLTDSLTELFHDTKPKAIFLPYETGPFALSFIIIARNLGIKTIGIAHSIIYEGNPMYSFDEFYSKKNELGFPIPDITLVFGNFSKEALIKQGYPKSQILAFGNPAFFNLDKTFNILENSSIYEKYGITKNKKIILFTTSYLQEYYTSQGKYNYDTQIWTNLLDKLANKDSYTIILKPHPTENTKVYEKILKKYNATNFKIIQGDLFELIHVSTIIISVISSTIMDALCFMKPVIRVKFDNIDHPIPYAEYGVILETELNNLFSNINELINKKGLKEKLQKNCLEFIKGQYNLPEQNPQEIIKKILNNPQ